MRPPFRIQTDEEDHPPYFTCHSVREVLSTLDDLQRVYLPRSPIVAMIGEEGRDWGEGDCICIGLGVDPSFANINIRPCDGEFYLTVGDPNTAGTIRFGGFCGESYFDRKNFVSWGSVLRAVQEFLESGRRSTSIRWHDWSGKEVLEDRV